MEMKTKGLGFAAACGIQVGGVVVVGGVLRRVMEVANEMRDEMKTFMAGTITSPPLFKLDGIVWMSWQQCSVYAGRTVKELAQEAIDIQNACNPLGLSKGYARALQELRWALEVEGKENDTDAIKLHPINRLWLDKLCDLAGYDRDGLSGVYHECQVLAGIIACTNAPMVEHLTEEQTKERMDGMSKEERHRMVYGFAPPPTTSHTGGEHDMGGE